MVFGPSTEGADAVDDLVDWGVAVVGLLLLGESISVLWLCTSECDAYHILQGGFVGRLFDLYGPRPLMLAGSACYVMSIMLTSICVKYYQYLLVQGLLFGLGVGLMCVFLISSTLEFS